MRHKNRRLRKEQNKRKIENQTLPDPNVTRAVAKISKKPAPPTPTWVPPAQKQRGFLSRAADRMRKLFRRGAV